MPNKLKNNLNKKKKQKNNKMDLFKLESRLDAIDKRLDKIEKTLFKKDFTENDYWNGDIPEDKFDEALNKYGYEYTPTSSWTSAHDVPEDYKGPKTYDEMVKAGYEMTGDGFWIPGEKRIKEMEAEEMRSKIPDRY